MFFDIKGDRPHEGSSRSKSFGFDIKPLPTASICCSPPLRVPAACFFLVFKIGNSSYTCSRVSSLLLRPLSVKAPISRFSRILIPGKSPLPSGTRLIPISTLLWIGVFSIAVPSNIIPPAEGLSNPEMVLKIVVFPAPLAPMSATTSFFSTLNETSQRALKSP